MAFSPETDTDDLDGQLFIVVDKHVLLELGEGKLDFTRGLLILLAVYFAFNLRYDDKQKLMFSFLEEHVLGLKPVRKSLRYNKYCNKIFARKPSEGWPWNQIFTEMAELLPALQLNVLFIQNIIMNCMIDT